MALLYAVESWRDRQIALQDAAQIAYEQAERLGVLDLIDSPEVAPEHKLDHFKYACMVDDEITLYGARPPSRIPKPIPRNELSKLRPVPGESQFNFTTPYHQVAYTDVTISKRDLDGLIRRYAPQVIKFKKEIN